MSSTTSRWMSSSWLNASSSWVRLTVPSIEFSIGDEPEIDLAGLDRVEHVGHRAEQHELAVGEVGLRLQRLLGERAERPEEPDARSISSKATAVTVHGRQATARTPGSPGSMFAVDEAGTRAS